MESRNIPNDQLGQPLHKIGNKYRITYHLPTNDELISNIKKVESGIGKNAEMNFLMAGYKVNGQLQPLVLPTLAEFQAVADDSEAEIIIGASGYRVFDQSFQELIKNSVTVNASVATVEFEYDQAEDKVHFYFKDNQDAITDENGHSTTRLNQTQSNNMKTTSDATNVNSLSGNGRGLAILRSSCVNRDCTMVLTSTNEDNERATIHITSPNVPYLLNICKFENLSLEEKQRINEKRKSISVPGRPTPLYQSPSEGSRDASTELEIYTNKSPSSYNLIETLLSPAITESPESTVTEVSPTPSCAPTVTGSASLSRDSSSDNNPKSPLSGVKLFSPEPEGLSQKIYSITESSETDTPSSKKANINKM